MEGREQGAGSWESLEGKMKRTSSLDNVSTKLQRIAKLAARAPQMVIQTLAHHIDAEFLHVAYQRTRKDGAVGVDGQTAEAYEANLGGNLQSLLDRFKSGSYFAPPVRRVHIPKDDGSTRPIGIPTFEDKVLQRAVVMVLEAVYEQDFVDCSYGFRPKKTAHQALQRVWDELMRMGGGWVLEVDIRHFFDSVDHHHLRVILDQRVRDGVIRRTIDKWLKAGVLEDGAVRRPDEGTPQGGVVSPLLANVYLHEVLDVWFEQEVRPRLDGSASLIRYADDAVMIFARQADAQRVMDVLPKRFGKYGLTLHPAKTRLLDFRRPSSDDDDRGSFDLLGFTHFWGKSWKSGRWLVKRKTMRARLSRAIKRISEWCRRNRHLPVHEQHKQLVRKMAGHYGYYGITGNMRSLTRFVHETTHAWRRWLDRRSNRKMTWQRFKVLLRRYPVPPARIVHSVYRS